ncbi:MAG: hypothetical protein ACO39C_10000 [Chthoniobacterales bacterium]
MSCAAQAAAAVAAAGGSGGPSGLTFGSTGFGQRDGLQDLLVPIGGDQDEDFGSDEPDAGETTQRTRTFWIEDKVRLWEVMASHQVSERIAQHEQRQSRQQIDAGEHKDTLFADGGLVETMFNDPDVEFTPPHIPSTEELTDNDWALFDPNKMRFPVVKAAALKSHYNKFQVPLLQAQEQVQGVRPERVQLLQVLRHRVQLLKVLRHRILTAMPSTAPTMPRMESPLRCRQSAASVSSCSSSAGSKSNVYSALMASTTS